MQVENNSYSDLQSKIEELWQNKNNLSQWPQAKESIKAALDLLDQGKLTVAKKLPDGSWSTHQWLKQAILLSFLIKDNKLVSGNTENSFWFDKVDNKFLGWKEQDYKTAQIRTVPNCYVRYSAFLSPRTVVMPSFINVGAFVGQNTMIDSYVTVGSCAYIGDNCHIASGAIIGGVIEPLNATPVIIEDDCFVGANVSLTEGIIVGEGSVISSGVNISASTKIYNTLTNEILYKVIPPFSVVVPGTLGKNTFSNKERNTDYDYALAAAIIIKSTDEKTKNKTAINTITRK